MSKTRNKAGSSVAPDGGFTETRVDAPHLLRTGLEADGAAPVAAVDATAVSASDSPSPQSVAGALNLASSDADARAPLEHHARQLAEHLNARQRELDRREAQHNASHAELDSHWRNSRLWLQERQQELAETENELAEQATRLEVRSAQIDERASQLAASEQAHTAACRRTGFDAQIREQELSRQKQDLTTATARLQKQEALLRDAQSEIERLRRETEDACQRDRQRIDQHREAALERVRLALTALEQRRVAIEAEASRFEQLRREPSPQQIARAEQLSHWEARLAAHESRLVSEEKLCERHLSELQTARQAVERDREEVNEQAKLERQRIVSEQRRVTRELDQQRRRVVDAAAELDGRREALEQLRADLNRVHRESLEMRLATEELWAQLSGSIAPAALTQSLSRIRSRLADHHRLALSELEERRSELERLRTELAGLQEQLAAQKREIQEWAAVRQAEFDRQAERLAARQNELSTAQAEQLEIAQQWERQRLVQQQEIRRLATALRRAETAAAA